MYRFVSLLLIPMFVVGHVMPHSHNGSDVAEPESHSLRPHLHVASQHGHHGKHGHHGHEGESHCHGSEDGQEAPVLVFSLPKEHDSDAIYLAQTTSSLNRTKLVSSERGGDLDRLLSVPRTFSCDRSQLRASDPPNRYTSRPIYLLTASLRL